MEESIKKARGKAEHLLFQGVKEISDGLKCKDAVLLGHPSYIPISLEFEAHAYLAHKNKTLKPKYAEELREILVNWIQEKNGDKSEIADIFFPSYPHEGRYLETIAILRAIEILDIPGFQKNIDSAIKSMKEDFIETPIDFTEYSYDEWFIFRSKAIQEKLRGHIKSAALLIFDKMRNSKIRIEDVLSHNDDKYKAYYLPFWIVGSIFLVMSQQGEDFSSYAKYIIDRVISTQEENGSVLNNVLTTCSFIIAVYLYTIQKWF